MDRQINTGNRVIANFLQQKQKRRLQQRIKCIKQSKSVYSQKGLLKQKIRMNSFNIQKKFQIDKQNAGLFNRIASIIKQKPKLQVGSSTSLHRSRETSILFHRKIQSSLEQQNKIMQNRINNLKPTINNKLFYKQRAKHERYLKHIGKYPYILNRKLKTQPDGFNQQLAEQCADNRQSLPMLSKINNNGIIQYPNNSKLKYFKSSANPTSQQQLFKHESLDFCIRIVLNHSNQTFSFLMQRTDNKAQNHQLHLPQNQFIQIFQQCQYDYQKMISKLRLDNEGNVYCIRQKQNLKTPKSDFIKFKPNSTGYTSTYTKSNFKTTKRKFQSKLQNQNDIPLTRQQVNISKSQRKIVNNGLNAQNCAKTGQKSQRKNSQFNRLTQKEHFALNQKKFAQIAIHQQKK